jgi:hypothetical protein
VITKEVHELGKNGNKEAHKKHALLMEGRAGRASQVAELSYLDDPEALLDKNIVSITHLTNSQIVQRLEQQRLERLHKAGANLKCRIMLGKGDEVGTPRCPKCTLPLPCKFGHFESEEDLFCFKKSGRIFAQKDWFLVTKQNRDDLIKKKLQFECER